MTFSVQHALSPLSVPVSRGLKLSVITPVYNERHVVEASLRRVLALRHELISELELVVVDDCSRDGSSEILLRLAAEDERIKLVRHDRNMGKGAALRTGIAHTTGDVTIFHDADLEYNPEDIPLVLVPFLQEGADAVFGSRYISAPYRRALMYRHTQTNRMLTFLSNLFTDLAITDMETCYKAIRTPLLKSIPIRSNDFRIEVEIVAKLAKRRAMVFEVPIRYLPRSYEEGKKIRARDGVLALLAMVRYALIDDIYQDDEYGSRILTEMEHARRFNLWMGDVLRPWIGDRVLEIGAGVGTLTNQFIPRDMYLASDINPHYLSYLRSYALGKPYLEVRKIDATTGTDFGGLEGRFDTALMINVLEHVSDPAASLRHLHRALESGGRAVILVPQHPQLFGTLDEVLGHTVRYTPELIEHQMTEAGFRVETVFDFNRFSVPGWWLNGKILKKKSFSRIQLKILDTMLPVVRRLDRFFPWSGLSLIAIGVKD
jgi:glycosyltransferase involved in cell wall biosynthesis